MRWETIQLGEVMDVKHGFAFKGEFFSDFGELVLLTPGNCHEGGGLKLKGDKEKYYIGEFPAEFLLNEGDVLVVMTDLVNSAPILGGSFLIPENNKFLHNQRLGLVQITDEHRIDKMFLYYLLNTRDYRAQVRGSASGATVRHTSPGRIKECAVRVPQDVAYQRCIASILSAYDDLIENNQRRMALLEEAARQLYQEWFVRLRFPGHEHTRITHGVPEGWEFKLIGEVATLNYGKALKEENRVEGATPVYGSSGIVGSHSEALVSGPGLIVGRKGNVGSVFWSDTPFWPIDTVYFVSPEESSLFLYHCLRQVPFQSSDVAVPGLNRTYAHSLKILMPSYRLQIEFEEAITPMFEQLTRLRTMNQKLRAARDLLLPRLMSGEIAV
jgi:type I restriction enzyme S subunit